ncbi:2044_t:CDS:2, partial [Dentiscutata heterogama]
MTGNSNNFNTQEEHYEIDNISYKNWLWFLHQLIKTWKLDESVIDKNNSK